MHLYTYAWIAAACALSGHVSGAATVDDNRRVELTNLLPQWLEQQLVTQGILS